MPYISAAVSVAAQIARDGDCAAAAVIILRFGCCSFERSKEESHPYRCLRST